MKRNKGRQVSGQPDTKMARWQKTIGGILLSWNQGAPTIIIIIIIISLPFFLLFHCLSRPDHILGLREPDSLLTGGTVPRGAEGHSFWSSSLFFLRFYLLLNIRKDKDEKQGNNKKKNSENAKARWNWCPASHSFKRQTTKPRPNTNTT